MRARANLAGKIVAANFRRLAFPYKLTFVLTYWCNYRCQTCNIWQRRPEDELSTEEIQRFFERSNRFNWIDFTGGEVWLRKDFVEIAEAAIRHCRNLVLLHFPTNGYFTDRIVEGVEKILAAKPPKFMITVSLDGDEKTNDRVRGREGGWRRQVETFKRLKAIRGVGTVLGMTVSPFNARPGVYRSAFEAVKQEYPALEPEDFHVNIAHESEHYYGNEGSLADGAASETMLGEVGEFRRARGRSFGPVGFLEQRYLGEVEKYLSTGKTPVPCHALKSSCFIDSWGGVYPCGMYDAKIASLRDHDYDLEQIWNLPRTRELQAEIWEGKCPQCWTPCEAYQSILGNLLPRRAPRALPQPAGGAESPS